jgi:2-aminophenol/2-amino-5-chlorophenol 1,6-dioxygenase beta subunit
VSRVFQVPIGGRAHLRHARLAGQVAADPVRTAPEIAPPEAAGDARGRIVAGYLSPHPPHLIYAENPPQNEPRSSGGWEVLRWGYQDLRRRLAGNGRPDVLVVHAPHWITMIGHHVNCVPHPRGISVEPIFPHLFRYHYDFRTDVTLAEAILAEADDAGLVTGAMRDERVRVDYATIGALHMVNPAWDIPVVSLSANNNPYFYSAASLDQMEILGAATRKAVERTGRRAVLLASNSLSHLHWDVEPDVPEDMSAEHPYNHHQYAWDMKLLDAIREGPTSALRPLISEHIEATYAETKAGSLSWLLAAMGWPDIAGDVLAYGTVIGTGNAIVEWRPDPVAASAPIATSTATAAALHG